MILFLSLYEEFAVNLIYLCWTKCTMRHLLFLSGVLSTLILCIGCGSETIIAPEIDQEYEYANLALGKTWEYTYDSINYLNVGGTKQSRKGFLKITVEEDLGEGAFKISKSIRTDTTKPYVVNRIETIQIKDKILTTTDNNLRFINLVFPPDAGATWQGNRLFNDNIETTINGDKFTIYSGWTYTIAKKDSTLTVQSKSYPNTIRVVAKPPTENLLSKRQVDEYYSKNIGLVKRYMIVLNTQRIEPNTPWEIKGQSGFIYTQELISYK